MLMLNSLITSRAPALLTVKGICGSITIFFLDNRRIAILSSNVIIPRVKFNNAFKLVHI